MRFMQGIHCTICLHDMMGCRANYPTSITAQRAPSSSHALSTLALPVPTSTQRAAGPNQHVSPCAGQPHLGVPQQHTTHPGLTNYTPQWQFLYGRPQQQSATAYDQPRGYTTPCKPRAPPTLCTRARLTVRVATLLALYEHHRALSSMQHAM